MKASSIPQSHPIHFVSNFTDEKEIVFTVHPVKSNEIVETNECKLQAANVVENEILVPDGGIRAWVVLIFSFLCNGIIFGLINSYGGIYVALKNRYDLEKDDNSETKATFIGSLLVGSLFLFSPFSGVLVDRYGIRKTAFTGGLISTTGAFLASFLLDNFGGLCFTFSIMLGFGASLVYTPSVVILGHYFEKYLGIVNGIVTTGSSVFAVGLPHFFKWLIHQIGITGTLRIISIILSTLMLASLTFKPKFKTLPRQENSTRNCSSVVNIEIWQNRKYILWIVAAPIALLGYFVPYVHIVAYVEDILPGNNGETLLTCIAITSGIGKPIFGWLADRPSVNSLYLQQFAFFFMGCCTMLLTTANYFGTYSYASLIGFSLVMGMFDGCFSTMLGPIATQICGPLNASQAIGFLLGLCSGPLMVGPLIAGRLYKYFGSYTLPFICAGCPPIIAAVIMCGMHCVKTPEETSDEKDKDLKASLI